jgi:hypothetical protein
VQERGTSQCNIGTEKQVEGEGDGQGIEEHHRVRARERAEGTLGKWIGVSWTSESITELFIYMKRRSE